MSRIAIKVVQDTFIGEGLRAGTRAVVVRFSGCNLWDGNPHNRDRSGAACPYFCDADFVKGTPMEPYTLLAMMEEAWSKESAPPNGRWCLLTGGEPMDQVNRELIEALHAESWNIAVETNGTLESNQYHAVQHLIVSPKKGAALAKFSIHMAHEVKVILPGNGGGHGPWTDEELRALEERFPSAALYVCPEDVVLSHDLIPAPTLLREGGLEDEEQNQLVQLQFQQNIQRCLAFVRENPRWRLSLQQHKLIGIP